MVTKIDDTFTDLDLLEELAQYRKPIAERHGGVTAAEYADRLGCTLKTARNDLNGFVKDGKMVKEWSKLGAHAVGYVYYKNEKD